MGVSLQKQFPSSNSIVRLLLVLITKPWQFFCAALLEYAGRLAEADEKNKDAARSEVIKAVLLAGADRSSNWDALRLGVGHGSLGIITRRPRPAGVCRTVRDELGVFRGKAVGVLRPTGEPRTAGCSAGTHPRARRGSLTN